jgi:hypothetical protein
MSNITFPNDKYVEAVISKGGYLNCIALTVSL